MSSRRHLGRRLHFSNAQSCTDVTARLLVYVFRHSILAFVNLFVYLFHSCLARLYLWNYLSCSTFVVRPVVNRSYAASFIAYVNMLDSRCTSVLGKLRFDCCVVYSLYYFARAFTGLSSSPSPLSSLGAQSISFLSLLRLFSPMCNPPPFPFSFGTGLREEITHLLLMRCNSESQNNEHFTACFCCVQLSSPLDGMGVKRQLAGMDTLCLSFFEMNIPMSCHTTSGRHIDCRCLIYR